MTNIPKHTAAPTGGDSHLVVKRGHHGRYRFAMVTAHGRIKGEVQVDITDESRATLQARALLGIASVVEDIAATVAARIAAGQLEAYAQPEPVPTRAALINGSVARKGAYRGQV